MRGKQGGQRDGSYQPTGLIPKKKCASAYARNITQRAVGGGNRGKYSIYTVLYSRDHNVGRRKMCTAGANESELHPPTASRSDSELNTGGGGGEDRGSDSHFFSLLPP